MFNPFLANVPILYPMKTPENGRRSGVFIANFKHISHLFSSVSIINFEQVNVTWEMS